MVQLSHPYMTTGKTIALTRWTFVGTVVSLLFNMLSRLVIAFLPRIKPLLISWLQSSPEVIWEPKNIKLVTVSIASPSICHEVMKLDAMIFIFLMLSFKPAFSVSSFSFIKKVLMLSAIRMVSSAYLRLLISLPAILCQESVISLALSYWNKDLKQETSATAQLQLRVLFGKQRIVHPPGVRADWPQKRGLNLYWPPHFIHFVSSPLILPYANWASQEGVVFVSPEVLTLVCGFSFVPFLQAFPFLCLLTTAIFYSFFLF